MLRADWQRFKLILQAKRSSWSERQPKHKHNWKQDSERIAKGKRSHESNVKFVRIYGITHIGGSVSTRQWRRRRRRQSSPYHHTPYGPRTWRCVKCTIYFSHLQYDNFHNSTRLVVKIQIVLYFRFWQYLRIRTWKLLLISNPNIRIRSCAFSV